MHQQDAALIFRAFAHETRVQIVKVLLARPNMTASELVATVGCTQPMLSHHMKFLVQSKVVVITKDWKWFHYSVNKDVIDEAYRFLVTPCRYDF